MLKLKVYYVVLPSAITLKTSPFLKWSKIPGTTLLASVGNFKETTIHLNEEKRKSNGK